MTLTRIIVLLVAALAVMLTVVILRVEATRAQVRIAALDKAENELHAAIRAEEVELARWRSPILIRDRLRELRRAALGLPAEPKKQERAPSGTKRR